MYLVRTRGRSLAPWPASRVHGLEYGENRVGALTPPKICAPIPHLRGPFNAVIDGHRDRRDRASFRHAPWGDGGHRGRRDRRDRGNGITLGFAVAAVTTVIV